MVGVNGALGVDHGVRREGMTAYVNRLVLIKQEAARSNTRKTLAVYSQSQGPVHRWRNERKFQSAVLSERLRLEMNGGLPNVSRVIGNFLSSC